MHLKHWRIIMVPCVAALLGLAVAVVLGFGVTPAEPVQAQGSVIYVDDDTCPATGSGTQGDPYCQIQTAVDAAVDDDEVRVATGTYTGTQTLIDSRTGYTYTQVVFITRSLNLRGGYDAGDWNADPDPVANPTVIDAQGQGRGVSIVGTSGDEPAVTVEGFTLTGGDYTGLGNPPEVANRVCRRTGYDCGGGLFAFYAALTVRDVVISDNVASRDGSDRIGYGGGMYLWELQAGSVVEGTTVVSNSTAGSSSAGGGIVIQDGYGVTLMQSVVEGNYAPGSGGGMMIVQPSGKVVIEATEFLNNESGEAGAIDARLVHGGEALQMDRVSMVGNRATGQCAAVCVKKQGSNPITTVRLSNLLLAENRSALGLDISAAIDLAGGTGGDLEVSLAHVTAAGNVVPTFLYVESYDEPVTATLTNTLVVSFTNAYVGDETGSGEVFIQHANTLTDNVTMLHNTWNGLPTFIAVDGVSGDPKLYARYHLLPGSAAIDAGIDAGVTIDIDGDPRPYHGGFDIGADEFTTYKIYLPLVLRNQ